MLALLLVREHAFVCVHRCICTYTCLTLPSPRPRPHHPCTPLSLPFPLGEAYQCGGVLVKPDMLLTAAHCVHTPAGTRMGIDYDRSIAYIGMAQKSDRFNYPGDVDGDNVGVVQPAGHRVARLADVLVHAKYDPSNLANDVAVVRLAVALDGWPVVKLAKAGALDGLPPPHRIGLGQHGRLQSHPICIRAPHCGAGPDHPPAMPRRVQHVCSLCRRDEQGVLYAGEREGHVLRRFRGAFVDPRWQWCC